MRFIVTKELGKLARWLRILGFDATYYRENDIGKLAIAALRDNRTIITRNRNIPHLQKCTVVVASNRLCRQLQEVKEKLDLPIQADTMFTRCTMCNAVLEPIAKADVQERIPEHVFEQQEHFRQCPECGRIYWQGSHWGNIKEVIGKLTLKN